MPAIRVPALATFAGLTAGLIGGVLVAGSTLEAPVIRLTDPVGALWLKALKMTILPLVAGLLFTGIVQTVAAAHAGAMARKVLGLFLAILGLSAVLGVIATPVLLNVFPAPSEARAMLATGAGQVGAVPGISDFLSALIPENIVSAAAEGAMLPFVIFISLFALASTRLAEAPRTVLARFFEALAAAMMVLIGWVLMLAPIGVFALALGLAAQSGSAAIAALAHYIVLVSAVGALVLIGAYLLAIVGARQGGRGFAKAVLPAQIVAFSTQSSLASLPAMLASCRALNLRDTSGEFVLPLAVAIFRATSPAMNLAVAIYAAHLTGVTLGPAALIAGAGVALLVSLGTVSLPGTISFIASVGPIALAMGVPIEPLALLVAVEMLPDIMRTVGNVTMDVAVTAVAGRNDSSDQK